MSWIHFLLLLRLFFTPPFPSPHRSSQHCRASWGQGWDNCLGQEGQAEGVGGWLRLPLRCLTGVAVLPLLSVQAGAGDNL